MKYLLPISILNLIFQIFNFIYISTANPELSIILSFFSFVLSFFVAVVAVAAVGAVAVVAVVAVEDVNKIRRRVRRR